MTKFFSTVVFILLYQWFLSLIGAASNTPSLDVPQGFHKREIGCHRCLVSPATLAISETPAAV